GNATDDNVQGAALEVTRKPSKCYHCKQFGHVAKNCRNKKATSKYNSEASSSEPAVRHKKNQYKPKENVMTLSALSIDVKQDGWYIDSGASCHMCNNKDIMTDYEELPNKLQLQVANGDKLFGIGKGNVEVRVKSGIRTLKNNFIIAIAKCGKSGLYKLESEFASVKPKSVVMSSNVLSKLDTDQNVFKYSEIQDSQGLWHRRLGHLNARSMNLLRNGIASGINYDSSYEQCIACIEGDKVNISNLRVFGCLAYAVQEKRKKLDAKSKPYIFVGYCENTKGYRLLDPLAFNDCTIARNVVFVEHKFFKDLSQNIVSNSCQPPPYIIIENAINNDEQSQQSNSTDYSEPSTSFNSADHPSDETFEPDVDFESDDSRAVNEESQLFLTAFLTGETVVSDEPKTVQEALSSEEAEQWKSAMKDEYQFFDTAILRFTRPRVKDLKQVTISRTVSMYVSVIPDHKE
ncbi:hypothetical protein ACJJTC_006557, partial [Scirpophaga incertulas]